jgi:pimeloyl-ACP methyl ester carboxylesterase
MAESRIPVSDLRGYGRLGVEAAVGVTDIVERMHNDVLNTPGPFGIVARGLTGGVTAFVYRAVRGAMRLGGAGLDLALAQFQQTDDAPSSPKRDTLLAALNGVLGDHLAETGNPLALPMRLRFDDGRVLPDGRDAVAAAIPQASGRLVVFVHGLCMNDLQWRRGDHDYGAALARRFACTPLYLFYNSGLHISLNGRAFADQLERLLARWPVPVEDIVVIGHSMGGLVARSACHYAEEADHAWRRKLSRLIFLGTPHLGAPLERIGNWVGLALARAPYTAVVANPGKARSAGVTDLRHGALVDEDWTGQDRFAHSTIAPRVIPLPGDVACYAIAATTARDAGSVKGRLIGDGLVTAASALGRHKSAARTLAFPADHQWTCAGANHFDLLGRDDVLERIAGWMQEDARKA